MHPSQRTVLLLTIIGRSIFTFAAIALFLTGIGLISGVDILVRVAGWSALVLWLTWFSIVIAATLLKAQYRRKLASEFHR